MALLLYANPQSILYAKQGHGPGPNFRGKGIHSQLSSEQQKAVADKFQELWEQGLAHKEIHQEISQMLEEYGIQLPERKRQPKQTWEDQLSNEQRANIRQKRKELAEAGASRQEIHEQIQSMLKEYGIEAPEFPMRSGRRGPRMFQRLHGQRGFGFFGRAQQKPPHPERRPLHGWLRDNLSEEQLQQVKDKREELHKQGASREEIHAAIKSLVADFGLELPEPGPRDGRLRGNLTPQQREELRQKRHELFQSGATPEEIHQEMQKLIEKYTSENDSMTGEQQSQQIKELEDELRLYTYPNPFNPHTTLEFEIQDPAHVSMKIYNISGQLVDVLMDTYQQAGIHLVNWNGLNRNGQQVPSGVYFVQLNAGNENRTERIVLMK
jgi:hypothetical protein